jgi:hypothetical protein
MNKVIVNQEVPFQIFAHTFAIAPTTAGYTLYYSADGKNYTAWDEGTPADENCVVTNAALGMYFYLDGNTDNNVVVTC